MRGMSKSVFSKALAESCVSVWVDDIAGFGGFALESMKCGTPVIGKIPNLLNGWMDEKNGIWVDSINAIPDVLSKYLQAWLEDNYSPELLESMKETVEKYTPELQKEKIKEVYGEIFNSRTEEFKTTLSKYKVDNVEEKIN
jgi:glycosyltransferase involved in cell wall biosynthesis